MTMILGFTLFFLWAIVVPLTSLIALILFIVGLSTDDEAKKLKRQRFRLALWFFLLPLAAALAVALLTVIVAAATGAA